MAVNMRPGDWCCASCSNHNFANRVVCNKCSAPRDGGGYGKMPTGTKVQRLSPYQGPKMGNVDVMNAAMLGNVDMMAVAQMFTSLIQGHVQPPVVNGGKAGNKNPQGDKRPGDWTCHGCKNNNFASRTTSCGKCGIPKSVFIASTGMRVGDWICSGCSNHNYSSKTTCNKCDAPKATSTAFAGSGRGTQRPGDWICGACNNLNFKGKTACNKCGASGGVATTAKLAPSQAPQARPGDWTCVACTNSNYASRTACNKCKFPRQQ